MSYRNKTYVIFDGDKDIRYYRLMTAWKSNDNIDFNFYDAHDIGNITVQSSEENTKRKLRERFRTAKQVIVLVGESTKNLFRFVRWEIQVAKELGLPIIVVNLNGNREIDTFRCPAILRGADAIHVSFNQKIIKYALDNVSDFQTKSEGKDWRYRESVYKGLNL